MALGAPVLVFSDSPLSAGAIASALVCDKDVEGVLLVADMTVAASYAAAWPLAAAVVDVDARARTAAVSLLRANQPLLPLVVVGPTAEPRSERDAFSAAPRPSVLPRSATRARLVETLAVASNPNAGAPLAADLTGRQTEVARLMTRGLSNPEIAHELGISVSTVKNHVHTILKKLHVQRRSSLSLGLAGHLDLKRLP